MQETLAVTCKILYGCLFCGVCKIPCVHGNDYVKVICKTLADGPGSESDS